MILCPNFNSPEYKKLQQALGSRKTFDIFIRLGNTLPSMEEIPAIILQEKTPEKLKESLDTKEEYVKIKQELDSGKVIKLENQEGYAKADGTKVSKRVTEVIETVLRKEGLDYKGPQDDFYALKGTVAHMYLEEIGKALKDGREPEQLEIQKKIFKLSELKEFKDKDEKFFRINARQFKHLVSGMQSLFADIAKTQKELDPKGEYTLYFELPVLDVSTDTAGTIDLAVLYSDGSMGIFDYKTFNRSGQQAPGQTIQDKWALQIGKYKSILKDNYGVSSFRQSRIIPIQVNYSEYKEGKWANKIEDGFKKIIMQNDENREAADWLDAIPIEELTGNDKVDTLIKELLQEKRETNALLKRARAGEKSRLINKLTRVNSSLKALQLQRDSETLILNVKNLVDLYSDRLNLTPDNSKYLSLQELNDAQREISIYTNLSSSLKDQVEAIEDEAKRKKLKAHLAYVNHNADMLYSDILEELAVRVGKENLDPGEQPGALGRNFLGIQDWNIPVFQRLNSLIREAENLVRTKTFDEIKRIQEVDSDFSEWAKAKGYGAQEKFNLLYNQETGKLHSQFSSEFWSKKREINKKANNKEPLSTEEKEWMDTYFVVDKERYTEIRDKYFKNVEHQAELEHITPKKATELKKRWVETNSSERNKQNFYQGKYLKVNETVAKEFYSEEWKFIQANEPLKAYYDMYIGYNTEWTEQFGYELIGKNFVANVRKGLWDNITEFGISGLKDVANIYRNSYEVHQEDEMFGATDKDGNNLSSIPLLYSDPVYNDPTQSTKKKIEEDVSRIFPRGSAEFNKEVSTRIAKKGTELGLKTKSADLTKSLMLMVHSVNNYTEKTAIEAEVKALRTLIATTKVEDYVKDKYDQPIVREAQGDILKKLKFDPELISYFDRFVDKLLYGRDIQKDHKIGKYSGSKIMKSLMQYMSVRSLGLNFTIQAADYIQGKTAMHILAKEGRYFKGEDWKDAISSFGRKDSQFINVSELFQPESRNLIGEEIEKSGATFASRQIRSRNLFVGYIWSDDNISKAVNAAMSKHYVVDTVDGKKVIKNPAIEDIKDKNAPTVYDAVQEKDGKVFIPQLSIEEYAKFRDKVQKILYNIRGVTNERQKGLITDSIVGQSLLHFRSWIPGTAQSRFSKLRYDNTLESLEIGRFNAAIGGVIHDGFLPSAKEFIKIVGETASMGLLRPLGFRTEIDKANAERLRTKFLEENPQYKDRNFTVEQFQELYQQKTRALMSEMRLYMAFFVLVQLLGGFEWDDEEAEGGIFTWNAYQIAQRALLELSFFWSPSSVDEIISSPLAVMGQVMEFTKMASNGIVEITEMVKGVENKKDKTPLGYYALKNTPVLNQVLDITGWFNKYNEPKSLTTRIIETILQ